MLCPPKFLKENFPNDREYTFQTLVEQLALMELHIRDGSWRLCSCNPEKHLPGVAGLASEGFGFAETEDELHFMECLMNQARVFKAKIRSGEYRTQEDMNAVKDWARESRHRLEAKNWSGEWSRLEKGLDHAEIMTDITKIIGDLRKNSPAVAAHKDVAEEFLVMERKMAQKLIAKLSKKYGVDPPKLMISDKCHDPNRGIYSQGIIYMCQSGINLHVLAHEFRHHVQKEKGTHMDEGEAEKFAIDLFETQPQQGLYSNHAHSHNDHNMVKRIKDVGVIYGLQQLGYATSLGLKYADTLRPEGILGQPISLWGDLLGTIAGIIGALKLKAPYDLVAAMVGGYLSTDLWSHLSRLVPVGIPTATPPTLVYTTTGAITPPPVLTAGRYAVVA